MPEVRADLYCRVDAFDGAGLSLRVQVQNQVSDPDGLRVNADIDGTAGAMAVPTTLTPQKVEMRAYVDNERVPEIHYIRVTRSRKNNLQSWELTVPIHRTATGYAGAWVGGGVGLCKRRIDIYGVYRTTTGVYEIPLITNGIADTETRESNGGALITYTGVDAGGRYDGEQIDFILPPGSGLPRERVIRIAATRAGVEDISLEYTGVPMMKEFQLADAQFLQPCQELADVEGRVIQWDRSGDMVWPQYGSGALVPSTSRWSLNEKHWVAGSGKLTQPGELLTEVTVEGDAQVLVGACGDVTTTTTITTSDLNGPVAPAYVQAAGGYSGNAAAEVWTDARTVRVEILETTKRCDVLVFERRRVYEFYNPEQVRYEWDTTTGAWIRLDCYTDDNATGDEPAYSESIERWRLVEQDETNHYWLRATFEAAGTELYDLGIPTGGNIPGRNPRYPIGWSAQINGQGWYGTYSPTEDGLKVATISRHYRWAAPRKYVKSRSLAVYPYPIWEEVEPADGWQVYGGKEAAITTAETFILWQAESTVYGIDSRGYRTDEVTHKFGYYARKGAEYLYGDDTERSEAQESFRYLGTEAIKYIANGEQAHDEIVTETDLDGKTTHSEITTGLDSYLPAAERIPDSGPPLDEDVYEDDAELAELYAQAYRTETKPISVTVTDDDLENCSTRGVHKVQSAYLENEDEADWLARWLIDEGYAARFDGELAGANFFIEPGDWCAQVRYRQIGVDGAGRVEEVSWQWAPGAPINTQVQILLYEVNS